MDHEKDQNIEISAGETAEAVQKNPPEKKSGTIAETIRFAIISLIIVIPFRIFVAQPFVVSGASMDPTFENGEYLIVDQVSYRFSPPARGDVIIFKYPRNPSTYFIKRIVGLPNEKIEIHDGQIYITGASSTEPVLLPEWYLGGNSSGEGIIETVLRDEEYFVMGDNRLASSDSRSWGPLKRKLIVGTPIVRLFPISRIDFQPGE